MYDRDIFTDGIASVIPHPVEYFSLFSLGFSSVAHILHRISHRTCSLKEAVLKNFAIFTGKQLCWKLQLCLSVGATLLKSDSKPLFSCEYCKIFKNTYFEEHLQTVAFVHRKCYGKGSFFIAHYFHHPLTNIHALFRG